MAEMLHQIQIKASPEKVYEALTAQNGLRSWWTSDTVAKPEVGSVAEFGFNNRATVFRMRVAELTPNQHVIWECLGDIDEWIGTRLIWELKAADNNFTNLRFTHANWRSTEGWFAMCNSTWGELIHRLKNFAEGKTPGPHFKG